MSSWRRLAPPRSSLFWAGLPFTHRQICRIGCFADFCFVPLPLPSSFRTRSRCDRERRVWQLAQPSPAPPNHRHLPGRGSSLSSPRFKPMDDATGVEANAPSCLGGGKAERAQRAAAEGPAAPTPSFYRKPSGLNKSGADPPCRVYVAECQEDWAEAARRKGHWDNAAP
jgi:hypothetical protein